MKEKCQGMSTNQDDKFTSEKNKITQQKN